MKQNEAEYLVSCSKRAERFYLFIKLYNTTELKNSPSTPTTNTITQWDIKVFA